LNPELQVMRFSTYSLQNNWLVCKGEEKFVYAIWM
jgi:hypothetical protein